MQTTTQANFDSELGLHYYFLVDGGREEMVGEKEWWERRNGGRQNGRREGMVGEKEWRETRW